MIWVSHNYKIIYDSVESLFSLEKSIQRLINHSSGLTLVSKRSFLISFSLLLSRDYIYGPIGTIRGRGPYFNPAQIKKKKFFCLWPLGRNYLLSSRPLASWFLLICSHLFGSPLGNLKICRVLVQF